MAIKCTRQSALGFLSATRWLAALVLCISLASAAPGTREELAQSGRAHFAAQCYTEALER